MLGIRAAVLLAYLSLGVSLGVVVEEEGEGWTIASTAPSVPGSSPRRDGPSPRLHLTRRLPPLNTQQLLSLHPTISLRRDSHTFPGEANCSC